MFFLREEVLFNCEKQHKRNYVYSEMLSFSTSPCITAVTLTHPTFLLSRNTDSLVLSLWNQFSLLQVRSLALLLHVSNDRSTFILAVVDLHSVDGEITCTRWKHSLEICGTVRLHELLFGSKEDVGFKPEHREAEVTLGSSLLALVRLQNAVACVCMLTDNHLMSSALTWHPGWSVSRGADVSPPAVR